MNNDLKELLHQLKIRDDLYHSVVGSCEIPIKYYEAHLLLDYITNLQEENENLKGQIEWYKQQCDDLEMQIGSEEK